MKTTVFCFNVHCLPSSPTPAPPAPALPPSRRSLSDSLGPRVDLSLTPFSAGLHPLVGPQDLLLLRRPHIQFLFLILLKPCCAGMKENKTESQSYISLEAPSHSWNGKDIIVNQHHFLFFVASPTQLTRAIIPALVQINQV